MLLLTADKICKSYTERALLDNISISINEGDKIGLIGVNGTGKSTLLKIIAGADSPDSGTITTAAGVRISYLPQNPVFANDLSVFEQAMKGVSEKQRDAKQYECKAILNKLGLSNFNDMVETLSGGQKKRLSIACALVAPVDVLILDEPTNHIDNNTVEWLEDYLAKYNGALLMVTHDRYFLDRVTNKIMELSNGEIFSYLANYSKYLELKLEREAMAAASERKRQTFLRKELAWIKQGPTARGTKQNFRVNRYEEMSEQESNLDSEQLKMSSLSKRLGKTIVTLENINMNYGNRQLIKNFSYTLLRNDRIGIIGDNGCGKSTLLKIITGQIKLADNTTSGAFSDRDLEEEYGTCGTSATGADCATSGINGTTKLGGTALGSVKIGDTVSIGYFSQECDNMDLNQRVIDYIKSVAGEVVTPDGTLTATQMLETFLFSSDLQYSTIGRLSGGERRRLYLLSVLMEAPNVLLFDEPTNDLDTQTLSILEDYLDSFKGAVVVVSHDRYFLDKVVERIFAFEDGGEIREYTGGYSDYIAYQKQKEKMAVTSNDSSKKPYENRPKTEKLKFSFKEQREFDLIDDEIANLEQQIEQAENDIASNASDYAALQTFMEHKAELEAMLAGKMERWVYLNDLADKINAAI